jgi:hypothetical protein
MDFALSYSGPDGTLSATLTCDGQTIGTVQGLTDKKAVHRWAAQVARDYKVENTPAATEQHYVSVTGSKTFSL